MPKAGFLNTNEFIAYPFIYGQTGDIPDCAVVDFGSIIFAGAEFVEGVHRIWLEWVRRLGNTIEFSFRTDAPGLADKALIFHRDINDGRYVTSYSWAQTALTEDQLAIACGCEPSVLENGTFGDDGTTTTTTTTIAPGTTTTTTTEPPGTTTTTTAPPTTTTSTTLPPGGAIIFSDSFSSADADPYLGLSDGLGHTVAGFTGLGSGGANKNFDNIQGNPRVVSNRLEMATPSFTSTMRHELDTPVGNVWAYLEMDRVATVAPEALDIRFYTSSSFLGSSSILFRTNFAGGFCAIYVDGVQVAVIFSIEVDIASLYVELQGTAIQMKWGAIGPLSATLGAGRLVYAVDVSSQVGSAEPGEAGYFVDNFFASAIEPSPGWPL